VKKILFIPPGIQGGWYMETHYEYLIRYLSDEFFIEVAQTPYPPYEDAWKRTEVSPFDRNPDDYDLLVPLLPSHWGVLDREKYKHKTAVVMYEPGEGDWTRAKFLASTTPVADNTDYDERIYPVRFGIDTLLFQPYKMLREDKLLHVGVVGSYGNPRRQIMEGIKPLYDMPGVRWMFFPQSWVNNGGDFESLGGEEFKKLVVAGGKKWPGIPNIYNRLDVLVRIDNSYGLSFPVLEAGACGVPVITTYQGIDHLITEAGGGILLLPDPPHDKKWPIGEGEQLVGKLRIALEYMRDHPRKRKQMGMYGRIEVVKNWQWDKKKIDGWRKFLREATK